MILIAFFAINCAYIGTRMGMLWDLLAEKHEEFNQGHVRDPYPLMSEKAGSAIGPCFAKFLKITASGMKSCRYMNSNFQTVIFLFNQYA